jgi:hypothetical protein
MHHTIPYRDQNFPAFKRFVVQPPRQPSFTKRELGAMAAVVGLADLAFYTYGGVGQALGLLCTPAVLWFAARTKVSSARLWVLIGCAVVLALRSLYWPSPLVAALGVFVLVAIAQVIRMPRLHAPELLIALGGACARLLRRGLALLRGVSAHAHVEGKKVASVGLSVAVVTVFAGVLCLANPALAELIRTMALQLLYLLPTPVRLGLWILFALAGLVLLRPSLRAPFPWTEQIAADRTSESLEVGFATNTLLGLNLLFLVHNVTEARQIALFVPPLGMSTQRYAHEGAIWLTVALMMLNLAIGLLFRGGLAVAGEARTARKLAYGTLAQAFVLAGFTFARMWMHVRYSGLSDLHIVGFLGAALVVFGLFTVVYKLAKQRSFAFLFRRQTEALVLTLVMYAALPTHAIAAQYNVHQLMHGASGPLVQLSVLHREETAVSLLPLLAHADPVVREGIHALLSEEAERLEQRAAQHADHLPQWSIASEVARTRVAAALRDPALPPFSPCNSDASTDDCRVLALSALQIQIAADLGLNWTPSLRY